MSIAETLLVLLMPVLLLASGLWSGAETAIFGMTYGERLRLRRRHPAASRALARLLARPRSVLICILLGNMLVNSTYFVVATVLGHMLGQRAAALAVGFSVAAVLLLILVGEVLAKILASLHRVGFAAAILVPLLAVQRVVAPLIREVDRAVVAPLARLLAPGGVESPGSITVEELSALIDLGAAEGILDANERDVLEEVVGLGTARVRDVMTPRVDVPVLTERSRSSEVLAVARSNRHRRIPVARQRDGSEIVGVLDVRAFLVALRGRPDTRASQAPFGSPPQPKIGAFVSPPEFIPETARLDHLLDRFRDASTELLVCVDERGDFAGLVQLEDLVGEIIPAGGPADAQNGGVVRLGEGRWRIPGSMSVRRWADLLEDHGVRLPARTSRATTAAGLVAATLARLPRVGDEVRLGNLHIAVDSMSGRRVLSLIVSLDGERPNGEDAS